MNRVQKFFTLTLLILLNVVVVSAQTASTDKQYVKDGLTFDYPAGWTLQDDSTKDAQQLNLVRANNDVRIQVFVHRGRVTPEKMPEAKKAFIDPYIAATGKQFVAMGAKPSEAPDSTDIAGTKAEGIAITASLGGEGAASKIYWTSVGNRVVMLTYFGPDKELKQFASAWDLVRNSIKVEAPTAAPKKP